jgi:hypothetical protein
MAPELSGSHRVVYQRVFQHPMPHKQQWRDVWCILSALAGTTAVADDGGHLKVTRNGRTLYLHRPRGKDFSNKKELMQVRHFLERSEAAAAPPATDAGTHVLVVIDHHEARVYRAQEHGTLPRRVSPDDVEGIGRHLHNVGKESNGQRRPELNSFYEAVAKELAGAEQILVFGGSTAGSSAMEHLLSEMDRRHPELARRVIGSVVIDDRQVTEDQLLAQARMAFAAHATSPSLDVFPRQGWADAD